MCRLGLYIYSLLNKKPAFYGRLLLPNKSFISGDMPKRQFDRTEAMRSRRLTELRLCHTFIIQVNQAGGYLSPQFPLLNQVFVVVEQVRNVGECFRLLLLGAFRFWWEYDFAFYGRLTYAPGYC